MPETYGITHARNSEGVKRFALRHIDASKAVGVDVDAVGLGAGHEFVSQDRIVGEREQVPVDREDMRSDPGDANHDLTADQAGQRAREPEQRTVQPPPTP